MWWEHLGITESEWRAKVARMNADRIEAFHRDFTRNFLWLTAILAVLGAVKL